MVTTAILRPAKRAYRATVEFYRKHGFRVVKQYTELWERGARELRKSLRQGVHPSPDPEDEGGNFARCV